MVELPTGTATFLLTDIEGSTRLWESDPEKMSQALERHDSVIDRHVASRGGVVIKDRGEGDSRFAVFSNPANAVAAAVAIQRDFTEEGWPTSAPVRVRIGLHTGYAAIRDGDYYGSAVNRCARIRSLGFGGQTLLSAATHEVIKDEPLPERVSTRDLGLHRLKDLTEPERVFQVVIGGIDNDFPPLKSLNTTANNLPEQLTEFVGRERELARACGVLGVSRLLTILAPGGAGKTRFALQLAADLVEEYPQGVFLIELAHIPSVDEMVQAIAEAIGVPLSTDQPELEQLLQYLANKRQLLVMDNFEHLTAGADLVIFILQAAPDVDVLVTSRTKLSISGETVLHLPGLDSDWDTPQEALDASSVKLFVNTARRSDPGFTLEKADLDAVREIVTLVQGMPLGIILAAAWADLLPIEDIAAEIRKSIDFLESDLRDLPERQGSIRAVFDYSWAMLDDHERSVFSALSVFRGGFTREAAEHVAGASLRTLASLTSKSFLTANRETGRFAIHELLRQYGSGELAREPERLEESSDRHAAFYADLAAAAFSVIRESDQPRALRMMDADIENVRTAWRRSLDRQRPEEARQFIEPLWFLYEIRGWFSAADIFNETATVFADRTDEMGRMAAALASGAYAWFLTLLSQPDHGALLASEAVSSLHSSGDVSARALALQALCLSTMYSARMEEHRDAAVEALEVTHGSGDAWAQAVAQTWATFALIGVGETADATRVADAALAHLTATNEHWSRTFVHTGLAHIAAAEGRHGEVLEHYQQSVVLSREIDYIRGLQWALNGLGGASAVVGDFEESYNYYRESLELSYDLGQIREMLGVVSNIACVRIAMGDEEGAVELLSAILADPAGSQQLALQPAPIHAIAEEMLTDLESRLVPEIHAAAFERGRFRGIEALVRDLLLVADPP